MTEIRTFKEYPSIYRLFLQLQEREHVLFLDSSLQEDSRGRYSVLACRPYLTVTEQDSVCYVDGKAVEETFTDYVSQYLRNHREENPTDLPIISGAAGFFSYDFGREEEGVRSRHKKELDIPECVLRFYDCFIIEDHQKQTITVAAGGHTAASEAVIREIQAVMEELQEYRKEMQSVRGDGAFGLSVSEMPGCVKNPDSGQVYSSAVEADFSAEDYMEAVDHMIRYIVDGDIYVVNMTHQLQIRSDCPPLAMFHRLRERNPSPFGGYLDYGDFQVVCASPERFMKMTDGKISTRPIKGTRRRGTTEEEDRALKAELADSAKDQSELLMIVDLERNDLNRVCIPGSVQVTELFQVETYATVFHLESNVEGVLKPENNAMDLIRAAFPGGSITGAPKLRAMELIDQEERSRRNLYTGSIGYLSLNGDCDLNIVIRTAVHKDGVYHIGAGGGITCESELEFEYEETWQKAKALLAALDAKPLKGDIYEHTVR